MPSVKLPEGLTIRIKSCMSSLRTVLPNRVRQSSQEGSCPAVGLPASSEEDMEDPVGREDHEESHVIFSNLDEYLFD